MSQRVIRLIGMAGATATFLSFCFPAVSAEFLRKRAPVRSGLPQAVAYGHDMACTRASVTTSAAVEEQILLTLSVPKFNAVPIQAPLPWQNAAVPSRDSILGKPSFSLVASGTTSNSRSNVVVQEIPSEVTDGAVTTSRRSTTTTDSTTGQYLPLAEQDWSSPTSPTATPTIVRRKSFAPIQPTIVADDVTLDRIGLAIYETGHVAFTGVVSHVGGTDGLVRGSDVTFRVRGYGINRLTSPALPNGPLYFEMRRICRVSKGDSAAVSLVPCECCETIRARYDEITHLEVILESRRSR